MAEKQAILGNGAKFTGKINNAKSPKSDTAFINLTYKNK